MIYGSVLRHSGMLAFADAFAMMAVVFLTVIPLMLMMKKIRPVRGPMVIE
jgi:hypothetical protein